MKSLRFMRIRIILVLLISITLAWVSWSVLEPQTSNGVFTVVLHEAPAAVVGMSVAVTLLAAVLGTLVGGGAGVEFAGLAVGVTLSTWAMMAGKMDDMLLTYSVADQRTSMFYRFIADAVIWLVIMLLGYNVPGLLRRIFQGPSPDRENQNEIKAETQKGKQTPSTTGKDLMANPMVNGLLGAAAICVVALALLKILVRSGKTQVGTGALLEVALPPSTAQIILAVFISFYIGVRLVLWVFDSPCWGLLLGLGLVAVISYFLAANNPLPQEVMDQAPHFVRSSVSYALMAPIHLIGIGTLAVVTSYWTVQLQKHDFNTEKAQPT